VSQTESKGAWGMTQVIEHLPIKPSLRVHSLVLQEKNGLMIDTDMWPTKCDNMLIIGIWVKVSCSEPVELWHKWPLGLLKPWRGCRGALCLDLGSWVLMQLCAVEVEVPWAPFREPCAGDPGCHQDFRGHCRALLLLSWWVAPPIHTLFPYPL
jgi:hypothetical protein